SIEFSSTGTVCGSNGFCASAHPSDRNHCSCSSFICVITDFCIQEPAHQDWRNPIMKICLRCQHQFSLNEWVCPACRHESTQLNSITAHAPDLANNGGGFRPEYFSTLSKLEAANFWFQ